MLTIYDGKLFKSEEVPITPSDITGLLRHIPIVVRISPMAHICAIGDSVYTIVELKSIPFKTNWTLQLDPKEKSGVSLVFDGMGIEKLFNWYPLSDMHILFIGETTISRKYGLVYSNTYKCDTYKLVLRKSNNIFYIPPFPNVHSDGKLCTGYVDANNAPVGFIEHANHILSYWFENKWNTDILSGKQIQMAELVKFSPEGNQFNPTHN